MLNTSYHEPSNLRFQEPEYHGDKGRISGHKLHESGSKETRHLIGALPVNRIVGTAILKGREGVTLGKHIVEQTRKGVPIELDMAGVDYVSIDFFRRIIMRIANEWGGEIRHLVNIINYPSGTNVAYSEAVREVEEYIDSSLPKDFRGDADIYDLNFQYMMKARELCREDPTLARIIMGIEDEAFSEFIADATITKLQEIAKSGFAIFAPRISREALEALSESSLFAIKNIMQFTSGL